MTHNIKRLQQYIPQLPIELLEVMTPRDDVDPDATLASDVAYDNDSSLLNATSVQAAIDEVENRVDNIEEIIAGGLSGAVASVFGRTGAVIAVSGDYTSTLITNSSGVTGATVTAALNTLDSGKAATAHSHTAGTVTFSASGDIASTDVQSAIQEVRDDTDTKLSSKLAITSHAAVSVVGRSANTSGDAEDIAAASNDTILRRVSDVLGFGVITIGMIPDGLVTLAKLATAVQNVVAKLGSAGSYKSTIQTVNAASATIDADADEVIVTYVTGTCTLTLPIEANAPIGRTIVIRKANTSSNGITITPDTGSSIQGGATNASVSPSFFTTASSTTEADQACMVTRTGSTTWRFA